MSEVLLTEKTHDGFQLRKTKVELPFDNSGLDLKTQMDLLICHLFVNDGRSIAAITRIGLDRQSIIQTLLDQGVISDRRQQQKARDRDRRTTVCAPC